MNTLFKLLSVLASIFSLQAKEPGINYVFCHGLGGSGYEAISYVKDHYIDNVKLRKSNKYEIKARNTTNTDFWSFSSFSSSNNSNNSDRQNDSAIEFTECSISFDKKSQFYVLYHPVHHFNYPSSPEHYGSICDGKVTSEPKITDLKKVSLAQDYEIGALRETMAKVTGDCILFGRSMGAATAINYMAVDAPACVKALILEAPFDSVERVVKSKLGFFSWTGIGTLALRLTYPAYDKNGIKPIDAITRLSKDLPIIFIHSKNDKVIPIAASRSLYRTLYRWGYKKVHLFELDYAGHNNATDCTDSINYQRAVHAFYKHYGFPHDVRLAKEGEQLFEKTRPVPVRENSSWFSSSCS